MCCRASVTMGILRRSREGQRVPCDVLPLNTFRALAEFMRYAFQTRRQLADSDGLIGYSLDANVPGRKFWILSVWEDTKKPL